MNELSLARGKLLLRATLGDARGHAEASLFQLRREPLALLTDVYTDPRLRGQRLSTLVINALMNYANRQGLPVVTYCQPGSDGQMTAEELWAFYVSVGFAPGERHSLAGPLGRLLIYAPS